MSDSNNEIRELEQSYEDVLAEFNKLIVEDNMWVNGFVHRKVRAAVAVTPKDVPAIRTKQLVAELYEKSVQEAGYSIEGGCQKLPIRMIMDHQTQILIDTLVTLTDLEISLVLKGSLKHTAFLLNDKEFLENQPIPLLVREEYIFWPAWLKPEAQNCPITEPDIDLKIGSFMEVDDMLSVVDQIMQIEMVTGASRGVKERLELYPKEICMMQGNIYIKKLRVWAEEKRQSDGFYNPFIGHDKRKTPTIKPGTFGSDMTSAMMLDNSSRREEHVEEKESYMATPIPFNMLSQRASSIMSSFSNRSKSGSKQAKSDLITRMIAEQKKSRKKKVRKSQRCLNFNATSVDKKTNSDGNNSPDPSSSSSDTVVSKRSRSSSKKTKFIPPSSGSSSGSDSNSSSGSQSPSPVKHRKKKNDKKYEVFKPYVSCKEIDPFYGRFNSIKKNKEWLEDFKGVALSALWDDQDKVKQIRRRLKGSARSWFNQLEKTVSRSWRKLEAQFRLDFCKDTTTKTQRYYNIKREGKTTALEYLWDLNAAAAKAKIDYRKDKKAARNHVKQFINSVQDPDLIKILVPMRHASISEVKECISDAVENKTYIPRRVKVEESTTRRQLNLCRGMKTEDSEADEASSTDENSYCCEQFKAKVNLLKKKQFSQGMNEYPPCSICGNTRHLVANCWKNLKCEICEKTGHPTDRCFSACKVCGKKHDKGDLCPAKGIYEALVKMKADNKNIPEEVASYLN